MLRKLLLGVVIASFALSLTVSTTFAGDWKDDKDNKKEEGSVEVVDQASSGTTTEGLPGVQVYQTGTLTSRLTWRTAIVPKYRVRGYAIVELVGNPTAKAWTTLSVNSWPVQTTTPCWTTTTCTSQTAEYGVDTGGSALNFAEWTLYYSDGRIYNGNATATHNF